jgi:hypothetical protein
MKIQNKKSIKFSTRTDLKKPVLHKVSARQKRILFCLIAIGFLSISYWSKLKFYSSASQPSAKPQVSILKSPQTLDELLKLSLTELNQCDIALMDLLCAQGLPGAGDMKIKSYLDTLDGWAKHVQAETERNFHQYRDNPADFYNSEGYFRMLMMAVVVYEDFGIRYNPNRITLPGKIDPNDKFFANSQDIFLNGLIDGQKMGTCSSMPVLYIAIGRRLGYPLKLVTTKAHLFVRWESGSDRFNVEATGKGMNRYDDEHFKQWPFPVSDAEIQTEGFLKSLTAPEELAVFLSLRGSCLKEAGHLKEAAECYANASRLAPNWNAYRALLADTEASSPSLSASKHIEAPQNNVPANLELSRQTVAVPDPNPLKQMNGQ